MNIYPWDLEERVEDALVAYLKIEIGETALIKAASSNEDIVYPCVVVTATGSRNAGDNTENAPFTGSRSVQVSIDIVTEITAETEETPREQHRKFKNLAVGALAYCDLAEKVNEMNAEGVVFSLIHMTDLSSSMNGPETITGVELEIIATPKEI